MIKSKVIDKKTIYADLEYPIIMVSKLNGAVVLFTSVSTGTMLKPGLSSEYIGEWSDKWNPSDNETFWRPLIGSVDLSNK